MQKNTNNTMQALWVGMGSLSSFALGIISAAILSRYFDKAEYGTYRQILYVYNTLLVIFSAGLPRVFAYYLPRFTLAQGKSIIWKISKLLFLFGMVFSIFLYCFSGIIADVLKNPELAIGLKYFSPIPMLLLPTLGIEGIFSSYKKTIYIAIYNTVTRILMLLFIVLPVILLKGTYLYAIYGWIIVSVISLGLAYYFKGIPFKGIETEQAKLSLKEIFKYSMPIVTASIAGIAIQSADQFYISRYFGSATFAEFANGFIQLPFVSMVTGATSVVLMPAFSRLIHEKTEAFKIAELWQNALLKSAIIIYPLVIFFIFYAKDVIVLLYSDSYANSAVYFQIAVFLNFFNIIIFAPLILAMGETKYYSKVHIILAILIWPIEYFIVILYNSPIAIAIVSVALAIIKVFIFLKYASKLINVGFFLLFPVKKLFMLILHASIVGGLITILIKYSLNNLPIIPKLMLAFSAYLILLFFTSKIFKIDYSIVYKPITVSINKILHK